MSINLRMRIVKYIAKSEFLRMMHTDFKIYFVYIIHIYTFNFLFHYWLTYISSLQSNYLVDQQATRD